jgi:glycosyltransferase involved in cell wall biosynthesis
MSFLFYDDSPVFGGHEVMSLAGLDAVLSATPEPVIFLASAANEKLLERLQALSGEHRQLKVETVEWQSSKMEALRNRIFRSRTRRLATRLKELAPDLVVAIQGNIEHSSLVLRAARQAGLRSTSYIPVPHSNHAMGTRFGRLRDLFCGSLFQLPDSFVTITEEMARLLRERGATAPVHLVYNGIDTRRFQPGDQKEAREALELPLDKRLLGIVGRIEFRQKQQHRLVEAVAGNPSLAQTCHLVFAGDGPDAEALRELLSARSVPGTVLSWCDPAPLYRSLDALIIPSRYEGLPLVMLEALASGTSVFGSNRDGMKDVLPPERRFEPNSPDDLARVLSQWIRQDCPGPGNDLVAQVREEMSLEAFRNSFAERLLALRADRENPQTNSFTDPDSIIASPES